MNTDILLNNLPIQYPLLKVEKQGVLRRGESARDKIKRRVRNTEPKRHTGFGHNSMTLVLLSKGDGTLREKEITVKLSQNGVFHITGVLDEKYDRHVVSHLHEQILATCPEAITGEWSCVRRVVLMNYKTKLTGITNLSRETLHARVRQKGFKTNYEPAVYPAVKIYFPETKWIAKVFRTGNVILTGMTDASECERLVDQLREVLA
jgi:TATA-box binding protein (TBP) (component of TFIID and TFIIIB)